MGSNPYGSDPVITGLAIASVVLALVAFATVLVLWFREQIAWTISMIVRSFYLVNFRLKGIEEWKTAAHCARYIEAYRQRQYQRNDDRSLLDRIGYQLNAEIDEFIIKLELGNG